MIGDGREINKYTMTFNIVISVALSPAGTYFATGSGDTRARVWSYESIQEM